MRPVLFASEVEDDLFRLTGLLVDQGYFSDFGYANEYIEDLVRFIVENIDISPSKPAPFVFSKGDPNVRYIIFRKKSRTTWYIIFTEVAGSILVTYISNNHVAGHYFNSY